MNCRTVQNSLSAHFDGLLSEERRRGMNAHLDQCRNCQLRLSEMSRVRAALRNLPVQTVPERVQTSLRVMASKERVRATTRTWRFEPQLTRFRLWVDNLMRPIALPFAGGLVSALLLFSMVLPSFTLHRGRGGDIPLGWFTEPTVKAQMSLADFENDADFVVEVVVDSQGRMVTYSIPKGSELERNPEVRRAIENRLVFTQFTPATNFGEPTYGKMYLSFQRRSIDIKS